LDIRLHSYIGNILLIGILYIQAAPLLQISIMVKLCYIVPLIVASATVTQSVSTEYVKQHRFDMLQQSANKKQVVLSRNRIQVLNDNLQLHPYLQKRDASYASSRSKQVKKIGSKKGFSKDPVINAYSEENVQQESEDFKEVDESTSQNDVDDESTQVSSYAFRKLQKKLGLKGKQFNMPVKEPVPDWDDQYYENDGRPIVYQVDTEELKDIMDHYLEMGKEHWAGFLATSDCSKFQKLLQKLKKLKGDDDCDDEPVKKPEEDCDDDKEESENKYGNFRAKPNESANIKGSKTSPSLKEKQQPTFANIPEAELDSFQSMLSDVISYWENEDARKILQHGSGLTYKDFDLDVKEESKPQKISGGRKVSSQDFDDFENYQTEDDELEGDERDDKIEDLLSKYENKDTDLFETMDPKYAQTSQQREWLKSNALRRAKMLQALFSGELDAEAMENDIVKFRNGDLYLEEDDNEVVTNEGFKLQSTNMAMYIFFMVEAMLFYLF
jgi:hypothetical protein